MRNSALLQGELQSAAGEVANGRVPPAQPVRNWNSTGKSSGTRGACIGATRDFAVLLALLPAVSQGRGVKGARERNLRYTPYRLAAMTMYAQNSNNVSAIDAAKTTALFPQRGHLDGVAQPTINPLTISAVIAGSKKIRMSEFHIEVPK
jgi:hypothetical protein